MRSAVLVSRKMEISAEQLRGWGRSQIPSLSDTRAKKQWLISISEKKKTMAVACKSVCSQTWVLLFTETWSFPQVGTVSARQFVDQIVV